MSKKKVCPTCDIEKSLDEFRKDAQTKSGRACYCNVCHRASRKRDRQENPDRYHEMDRRGRYKRDYGIAVDDYDEMFSQQGGKCAICGTTKPGGKKRHFAVDHDHETGEVRGLLCYQCNVGLGHFEDSKEFLEKAILYLATNST